MRVIQDKPGYFAKKMQSSMKGLGTDDSALIRVVVSRCESDMVQIMASFEQQFNAPLAQWIRVSDIFGPSAAVRRDGLLESCTCRRVGHPSTPDP